MPLQPLVQLKLVESRHAGSTKRRELTDTLAICLLLKVKRRSVYAVKVDSPLVLESPIESMTSEIDDNDIGEA